MSDLFVMVVADCIIRSSMPSDIFVLVPSYNHARFIEECLRSIFAQTLSPRKLLVIDDGSSDDSVAVITRVLRDCPFEAELIARQNRGLCATLNEGFSKSDGKYFAYIGSDDYWMPGFLEARHQLLERRPDAVLGYGHADIIDENGRSVTSSATSWGRWARFPDGSARAMLLEGRSPVSPTVVYRSLALEKVRWNEGARLEDYEMYLSLMDLGEFAFDPRVLAVWRVHAHNTSKDVDMLVEEVIAAQRRNRHILGLSEHEMGRAEARVRFRGARVLLQDGKKAAAASIAAHNTAGAGSFIGLAGFWARMCVPMAVIDLVRRSKSILVR